MARPVGQTLSRSLHDFDLQPVVIDMNVDTVTRLAAEGRPAIFGDATRADILRAAGIQRATYLLVTLPDPQSRVSVILTAREQNPDLKVLVRAHYLGERAQLEALGATAVRYEEVAVALAHVLLREVGAPEERIEAEAGKLRGELAPQRAPIPESK